MAAIEAGLLAIEPRGMALNEALIDRLLRAAHSIPGGADLLDLTTIRELAQRIEGALASIRSR